MTRPMVILSDFDGTIITEDASQLVLSRFGGNGWIKYDEMFARGEMGFEECVSKEFGLIGVGKPEILREYDRLVSPRKHFPLLISYARERGIPFTIVSGGLEFLIKEFLKRNGLKETVDLYVGRLRCGRGGMRVSFPTPRVPGSVNFKDDLVLQEKQRGKSVVYIGDGTSDFNAALNSDLAFAVRGSRLAALGRQAAAPFLEFENFSEIVRALRGAPSGD